MRVLIHSNFPGAPTGYGKQAGHLALALAGAGHDVAVSAYWGLQGTPTMWNGIPVYPGGRDNWGMDVIVGHYRHWNADLLITLMDTWCISADVLSGQHLKMAFMTPVDCDPLGVGDEAVLRRTHALPVAISRHGYKMLEDAFFKPVLMPHAIDTNVYAPPAGRDALREEMGLRDRFVIGINAANSDGTRKGFSEQFQAFARFRARHPDAVLLVHSIAQNTPWGGLDLLALADKLGIRDDVRFAGQHALSSGLMPDEALAGWYGVLDVLSNCSRGEGFGLPVIEAQSCGTPVVVTNASAMPELCGSGWKADGQRVWHDLHHSFWVTPDVDAITEAWEKARKAPERKRAQAREFALAHDVKRVSGKYWVPALEKL